MGELILPREEQLMPSKILYSINNGGKIEPFIGIFNGGEINLNLGKCDFNGVESVQVYATIQCADGVMALLMLNNALREALRSSHGVSWTLNMGYVPYGRQDRVCNPGEAASLEVFCSLINSMGFDRVVVTDPHSDVTTALLDNCIPIGLEQVFLNSSDLSAAILCCDAVVSPDAGAVKKIEKLARTFGGCDIVYGHKTRDTSTGNLSGFGYIGDVEGLDLLIVDDLADGGGTFIGLAKGLKAGGAGKISLYVTHGIFSRGVEELSKYFDHIYTTNCFDSFEESDTLTVIEL